MTRSVSSPTTNSTSIVPASGRRRSTSARVAARHQAAPDAQRGEPIEERLLLGRPLLRGVGDGRFEARNACRVGLGQPALARQLCVHRHQLARQLPLLLALLIGHPAEDVPLARREQEAKVVGAHPLGGLEGCRRVAVLGLQQREHRERRRGIARDRRGRADLRDLEKAIDGRDGRRRGGDGLGDVAARRLSASASATCARHSTSSFLSASAPRRARPAASSAAACAPLPASARDSPISARAACSARLRPVNASMAFLYEAIPSWNFSCAVWAKASPATALAAHSLSPPALQLSTALPVLVFGQREPAGDQIDERQPCQRAPGMREMLHRLEVRAAFDERGARTVQIAEPEVHVADAQERRALIVAIVPRLAFREHAGKRVECRAIVALRDKHAAQPFEGIGLAGRVRHLAVEVTAPRVVGDGGRILSLEIQNVPRADERRRHRACVAKLLLNGERFAIRRQRRAVFREGVTDGRDPEQGRRGPCRIVPLAFDAQAIFIRLQRALQVPPEVRRVGEILQRLAFEPLVADAPRHVAHALEAGLCGRVELHPAPPDLRAARAP